MYCPCSSTRRIAVSISVAMRRRCDCRSTNGIGGSAAAGLSADMGGRPEAADCIAIPDPAPRDAAAPHPGPAGTTMQRHRAHLISRHRGRLLRVLHFHDNFLTRTRLRWLGRPETTMDPPPQWRGPGLRYLAEKQHADRTVGAIRLSRAQ